jgi:hypothetical protein
MNRTWAIALALIVVASPAVGNPPGSYGQTPNAGAINQQQQPEGRTSEQKSAPDQRGTETAPLFVKIAPAADAREKAEQDRRQSEDQSASDWWLVKITALLMGIGALQLLVFGWQGYQMKRTVDSSTAAERAYIFVDVVMAAFPVEIPNGRFHANVQVNLRNHGKTPAILRKIWAYPEIIGVGAPYPTAIRPPVVDEQIGLGRVIAASTSLPQTIDHTFERLEWANVRGRNDRFLCVGEVTYLDIHGSEHRTGFCWEYQPSDRPVLFEIVPANQCNLNYYR